MSDNLKSGLLCLSAIGSAVLLGSVLLGRSESPPSTRVEKEVEELRKVFDKRANVVEICLSDIESIHEALVGEANSVELCTNRMEGGVTPSLGLIEQAVAVFRATSVGVHVLIRPRPGDFVYSPAELEIVARDILNAKKAGADGIVFGALTADGKIDRNVMEAVRGLSAGMQLTFHRAFDVCAEELTESLEAVVALKCDRLLTSGRAATVSEGLSTLRVLTELAKDRITIVAGSGVADSNVWDVIRGSQVRGVHAGSAVTVKRGSTRVESSSSGKFVSADMSCWDCVDSAKVATLVDQARRAWAGAPKEDDADEGSEKYERVSPMAHPPPPPTPPLKGSPQLQPHGDTGDVSNLEKSYIYVPQKAADKKGAKGKK